MWDQLQRHSTLAPVCHSGTNTQPKSTFHVQLHCAHYLQISMRKPLQSHPSKEIISCTVSPGMKSGLRRYMWLYKGTVEEIMKALFIKCLITTSQSTTPHYPPIIHIGSDVHCYPTFILYVGHCVLVGSSYELAL